MRQSLMLDKDLTEKNDEGIKDHEIMQVNEFSKCDAGFTSIPIELGGPLIDKV